MKMVTRELLGLDGMGIPGSDIDEADFIAWFDEKLVSAGMEDKVIADIMRRGFMGVVELLMVYREDRLYHPKTESKAVEKGSIYSGQV
jgi:hypothetical protein